MPQPQAGQRLPYHLAAILPPLTRATAEVPEGAPPREVFVATVRQQTAEGELVLDSPLGTIRIPNPSPAAPPQAGTTPQAAGENATSPLSTRNTSSPALPSGPAPPASPASAPGPTRGHSASAEPPIDQGQRLPVGTRLVLTLPTPASLQNANEVPAGPRLTATVIKPAETQAVPLPAPRGMAAGPQTPQVALQTAMNSPPLPSAGQKLPLELVSILPPAGNAANSAAAATVPASGSQRAVLATLQAPSPNGQAILALPQGLVALDQHIEGAVGTRLLLLPLPHLPAAQDAPAGLSQMFGTLLETATLLDGKGSSPALVSIPLSPSAAAGTAAGAEARAALSAMPSSAMPGPTIPNMVQTNDLLAQNLPRLGAPLAAGLAGFIRARLSDKPGAWPGSELRQALQSAGRPELVAKLEQGFGELARASPQTSQDGQWKTMVLPLLDEHALHQARLAIRRDPGKGDQPKDGKPASVHFLLDVELSRMGALQLDGLVRGKRFDLMLRTHKPLDSPMQNEIQRLFAEAKSATGITGEIYFQVAAVFASPDANAPLPPHAGGLIA
jgi:hypothetical protein